MVYPGGLAQVRSDVALNFEGKCMPLTRLYSVAQKHAYSQTGTTFRLVIFGSTVRTQLHTNNKMLRKIELSLFGDNSSNFL